jgi:HD-like signal output (HDOD) protein
MLLGLVSVVIVAAIGIAAWVLAHRRAPVRTAETGEWVFANPDETASRTARAVAVRTAAKVAAAATNPATATNIALGPQAPRSTQTRSTQTPPTPTAVSAPSAVNPEPALAAPVPEVVPLTSEEVFARLHQLSFGSAGVAETWPSSHAEVISATAEVLEGASTEDRYTPRRPSLLPQLLRAVNDEDVSRRELVAIISKDPSLVGNLLKMANSSFYRVSAQAVESIDRAVVILGNDGIRSLIAAALAQPIFQIRGGAFPKFPEIAWEHTFRTASATVTHTAIVEKSDPFAAQLLGLVAGMAGIVVFRVALDQYEARPKLHPHPGVMASLLDTQSVAVAKRISVSWGLSDRIIAALDDQTTAVAADRQTALGRSLTFGRLASALAVLYTHKSIDDVTAQISMPIAGMPATELQRLWTRLSSEEETAAPRKKPRAAAAR